MAWFHRSLWRALPSIGDDPQPNEPDSPFQGERPQRGVPGPALARCGSAARSLHRKLHLRRPLQLFYQPYQCRPLLRTSPLWHPRQRQVRSSPASLRSELSRRQFPIDRPSQATVSSTAPASPTYRTSAPFPPEALPPNVPNPDSCSSCWRAPTHAALTPSAIASARTAAGTGTTMNSRARSLVMMRATLPAHHAPPLCRDCISRCGRPQPPPVA